MVHAALAFMSFMKPVARKPKKAKITIHRLCLTVPHLFLFIVLTSLFMVFACLPSSTVFTPEVLAVVSTINLLGSLGSCLGLI